MQFEWDEAKTLENIRKHEIDFADVPSMFDNEMSIELDDRCGYGEDRWIGIDFLGPGVNDLNNTSRTNWSALESMTDEDIDYSDIPPLTDAFFENATLYSPANPSQNLVRLGCQCHAMVSGTWRTLSSAHQSRFASLYQSQAI